MLLSGLSNLETVDLLWSLHRVNVCFIGVRGGKQNKLKLLKWVDVSNGHTVGHSHSVATLNVSLLAVDNSLIIVFGRS